MSLIRSVTLRHFCAKTAFVALLCGLPALTSAELTAPVLLKAEPSAFSSLLPAPPDDDSPAGRADLAVVLRLQADRTPEQVARAQELAVHTMFQMGAEALGPEFNAGNLPESAKIFKMIRDQSRPTILSIKEQWGRPRPFQRDARVQTCVPHPKSSSYPSGHSIESVLWAEILSAAFPEKTAIFNHIAEDTMWSRLVGGVHFPSDTQAGLILGKEIARKMLESEDTQSAIRTIREEFQRLNQLDHAAQR